MKRINVKKLVVLSCVLSSFIHSWAYELVIPEGTTEITKEVVDGNGEITSVVIPNSVTVIGKDAFKDCSGLTSIEIPEGVVEIGEYAFYGCRGLTSVKFPKSVTTIGIYAFKDCSSLKTIDIPSSVTEIGYRAFDGCTALNPGWLSYDNGRKCYGWVGSKALHSGKITLSGIVEIGDYAFEGCSELKSIEIPGSVTKIGYCAFYGCSGLTSLTLPNSITEIGGKAFQNCSGLTSVEISENVTAIEDGTFVRCSGLKSIVIPEGVTKIGASAFSGCSGLTSVTLSNSIAEIGDWAFKGCSGLTSIEIPDHVTDLGYAAFEDCLVLTSVKVPSGVTKIKGETFYGCSGLTSVTLPNSITEIGYCAFYGCTNLKFLICMAEVPPVLEFTEDKNGNKDSQSNVFDNYSAYLYVPCGSLQDYEKNQGWNAFKNIKCLEASSVETVLTDVAIELGEQNVSFAWPATNNADTYTLIVFKDGEEISSFSFNANGQLTSVSFSDLKSASAGFQFNVTGLKPDSEYTYSLQAKDNSGKVLESFSGSFKTLKSGNAVTDIKSLNKVISVVDGSILVDAEATEMVAIYNAQGQCLYSQMGAAFFQTPSAGVYVVRCNDQSTQVLVK